jgi:hypothetical protein
VRAGPAGRERADGDGGDEAACVLSFTPLDPAAAAAAAAAAAELERAEAL